MRVVGPVHVLGVGLVAPGLDGWSASAPVLAGATPWQEAEVPPPPADLLPPGERRRATKPAKLTLQAAREAVRQAGLEAAGLRSVFASSGGDTAIIHRICESLLQPGRPVSPTDFHNSVHNAMSGYWAIGTQCIEGSVSLSAYDASFGSGLMEAVAIARAEGERVLLVAFDYPPPFPLTEKRAIAAPFATAMVLAPQPQAGARAAFSVRLAQAGEAEGPGGGQAGPADGPLDDPGLERLRGGNPAARALPLLIALARGRPGRVTIPYLRGARVVVEVAA